MFLVGLTGGISSGKSTVAARLVQHGAELIDADQIAREIVLPGNPSFDKIIEHFGPEVLDGDGFIDRPKLGAIVFADERKRVLLNEITHPAVFDQIANRLELLQAYDGIVLLDVPLLVESGAERGYDAVVVVAARPETQVARLVKLRGMTAADAEARIAAQAPLDHKLRVATHVIWNEDSVAELLARTDALAEELCGLARAKAAREDASVPND
jgi:dephospho-CoA kinase